MVKVYFVTFHYPELSIPVNFPMFFGVANKTVIYCRIRAQKQAQPTINHPSVDSKPSLRDNIFPLLVPYIDPFTQYKRSLNQESKLSFFSSC